MSYLKSSMLSMTLFGVMFISLVSCSGNEEAVFYEDINTEAAAEEVGEEVTEEEESAVAITDRKLIKEGWVEFETGELDAARKRILKAVQKNGGYISSDDESNSPGRQTNNISIRVPSERFDALLAECTIGVAAFESKEISVRDVTEEFLDVQARLKTKKELELRYFAILKKTNTIAEILEVERELEEIRSDIESIEGRLKYLKNRVSYSTLHISFYQSIPFKTTFGTKFKDGFRSGWNNLVWFLVGITHAWPFLLIITAILFGVRYVRLRKKK